MQLNVVSRPYFSQRLIFILLLYRTRHDCWSLLMMLTQLSWLFVRLPALCLEMENPCCIVKGKARTTWSGRFTFHACISSSKMFRSKINMLIYTCIYFYLFVTIFYRLFTRRLQLYRVWSTTVQNEDKLEFSKILEVIKVGKLRVLIHLGFDIFICLYLYYSSSFFFPFRSTSVINLIRSVGSGEVGYWVPSLGLKPRRGKGF